MDQKHAQKEIASLIAQINRHNELYYNEAQPEIADTEYDALTARLKELEEEFPSLRRSDSPTQRVGAPAQAEADGPLSEMAKTVTHRVKMLSLDNTYSMEELAKWHERVVKGLGGSSQVEYVAELKIDGVSASLSFEQGKLVLAATRGDGTTGEDVTPNVYTIKELPRQLDLKDPPALFEVRGEVYMAREDFEKVNRQRADLQLPLFANPRNATSGSLKLLDPKITAERHLKIFVHSLGEVSSDKAFETHWEFLEFSKAVGLPINSYSRRCRDFAEVEEFCLACQERRDSIPYDVDGVVIKVDSLEQ